jgi:hypothetical protein
VGLTPAIAIFGSGLVIPKRFLVMFLRSYFASRSLMRELVRFYDSYLHPVPLVPSPDVPSLTPLSSSNPTSAASNSPKSKNGSGFRTGKAFSSDSLSAFTSRCRHLYLVSSFTASPKRRPPT